MRDAACIHMISLKIQGKIWVHEFEFLLKQLRIKYE